MSNVFLESSMKFLVISAAVVGLLLMGCKPSEDSESVAGESVGVDIEKKDSGESFDEASNFIEEVKKFAGMIVATRQEASEGGEKDKLSMEKWGDSHYHDMCRVLQQSNQLKPGMIQVDDLPANMPSFYRLRLQAALQGGSEEEKASLLDNVFNEWGQAHKTAIENLAKRLVQWTLREDLNEIGDVSRLDAWIQLPREQRKARVYMAGQLDRVDSCRYWLMSKCSQKWMQDSENPCPSELLDCRRVMCMVYMHMIFDDVLVSLYADYLPNISQEFTLPEESRLPVLECLKYNLSEMDANIDNLYNELLSRYDFDESTPDCDPAEVRATVEGKLRTSCSRMKILFRAQLRLIQEAMTLNGGHIEDDDIVSLFEKKVAMLQMLFCDDINFISHFADWTPEDEVESFELDGGAPAYVLPQCMLTSEYMTQFHHRNAGESVRKQICKAYYEQCDVGHEQVYGAPFPHDNSARKLQFEYLKHCFADAEAAWYQHLEEISTLIEPSAWIYWGSGTGRIISQQMNILYENHYKYYREILNFR